MENNCSNILMLSTPAFTTSAFSMVPRFPLPYSQSPRVKLVQRAGEPACRTWVDWTSGQSRGNFSWCLPWQVRISCTGGPVHSALKHLLLLLLSSVTQTTTHGYDKLLKYVRICCFIARFLFENLYSTNWNAVSKKTTEKMGIAYTICAQYYTQCDANNVYNYYILQNDVLDYYNFQICFHI